MQKLKPISDKQKASDSVSTEYINYDRREDDSDTLLDYFSLYKWLTFIYYILQKRETKASNLRIIPYLKSNKQ